MLLDLLNSEIKNAINNIDYNSITELRLRLNSPIIIGVCGQYHYLANYGITENVGSAIICRQSTIDRVIEVASNNCLYTINDQIINGYIAYKGGVRIGVAGDFVYNGDKLVTIKNINSLNIRVPHSVNNCSLSTYQYIASNNKIYNTLVLSPAGAGKTTYIRDLAKQMLKHNKYINLLIVDERCEITGVNDRISNIPTCDILTNCNKKYAFDNGIRSLRPDVIITDEIGSGDIDYIANAITSGVSVIATVHASNINDIRCKPQLSKILENKLFDRYILLGANSKPGEMLGIYNENLECIGI